MAVRRNKRVDVSGDSDTVVVSGRNANLPGETLALTAGATLLTAALQMLLDQASIRGEAMRAAQYAASQVQIVELAALGAVLNQMFSSGGNTTRSVAVKALSTAPAPTPLAVS